MPANPGDVCLLQLEPPGPLPTPGTSPGGGKNSGEETYLYGRLGVVRQQRGAAGHWSNYLNVVIIVSVVRSIILNQSNNKTTENV